MIAAADEILGGSRTLLGVTRYDMEDPDWFFDPVTGRCAPSSEYCFGIDHRSETVTGNIKQVWELSRLQHVTVLAAAFALSGEEAYANRAASHLRSWWAKNPFLSGVHWTSGIEVGLRLITWVWAGGCSRDGRELPTCSSTITTRSIRSGGTSGTSIASVAGGLPPTTMLLPRPPAS